jgi:hypothetical protein
MEAAAPTEVEVKPSHRQQEEAACADDDQQRCENADRDPETRHAEVAAKIV